MYGFLPIHLDRLVSLKNLPRGVTQMLAEWQEKVPLIDRSLSAIVLSRPLEISTYMTVQVAFIRTHTDTDTKTYSLTLIPMLCLCKLYRLPQGVKGFCWSPQTERSDGRIEGWEALNYMLTDHRGGDRSLRPKSCLTLCPSLSPLYLPIHFIANALPCKSFYSF